jgi:hypothetical protein
MKDLVKLSLLIQALHYSLNRSQENGPSPGHLCRPAVLAPPPPCTALELARLRPLRTSSCTNRTMEHVMENAELNMY